MIAATSLTTTEVFSQSEREWAHLVRVAPRLAGTSARYLEQISVSLRPESVVVADASLRMFCNYLSEHHPDTTSFAMVGRPEIEGFKRALAERRTAKGTLVTVGYRRSRLGTIRTFFDRIIQWDWPDAPARIPMFVTDLPKADEPLPKFLDDGDAAKLDRAIKAEPDPLRRLVLELLLQTGMRVGELCALEVDAVVQIGDGWWLRVPLGKLHNDRYIPLLPNLLALLDEWRVTHDDAGTGLLLTNDGRSLNRHVVTRMLNRAARRAALGHLHPHQLRHTMATQAVNRGMRLEAIAAMLGHRTLRMTIRYARIANRTVADEYQAVSTKVEALYATQAGLDADAEGPTMRRVRAEHHRMLANGWCTRPAELDCSYETICEGCGFFNTTVEFKPVLQQQADHAATHDQPARAELYTKLIAGIDEAVS
jgi:site-specific recombinase XerD